MSPRPGSLSPVFVPLSLLLAGSLAAAWSAGAGRGSAPCLSPGIEALGCDAAVAAAAAEPLIVPGFRYLGNPRCSGGDCHAAEKPTEQSGQMIGDEYNLWSTRDPHHKAFGSLFSDASKAIASKMRIESASASARCLSCHATNAPPAQRDENFVLADNAVGCESCHGPGEKYLEPHAGAGWTAAERGKLGTAGLRTQHGLIDTTDLAMRASMCVSCHLQIDKDLLDAGHPPLQFEMYSYNFYYLYNNGDYETHWDDSQVRWIDAKLWAIGQTASWAAARAQVEAWKARQWDTAAADALVQMYGDGAAIAKKHFGADTPQGLLQGTWSADACKAAATDVAALAPKAVGKVQRKNIAFGVTALCEAWFKAAGAEPPEAYWTAYETAAAGGDGDDWTAAVRAMIGCLK